MSVREYPKFRWFIQWLEYSSNLSDERRISFDKAIVKYGCYNTATVDLASEDLEYFNTYVKPELDRQHGLLDKGEDI